MSVTDFELISTITDIEKIAVTNSIRELSDLEKRFGRGRRRKLKGVATVRLSDDTIRCAEIHWYEASGIGRKRMKIKCFLD